MGAAYNNAKRWVLTLLVSSTAAQSALDILEGTQLTATDGQDVQDGKFDDGLYHPSASPTTTKNHIESVLEAFSQILSANYPYYTPSTIDVQTLTWPQTLDIFGTTLTANPSPSVPSQTQNTQSLTQPTASATEATTSSKSATTSISTTRKPSSRTSSVSSTKSSTKSSTTSSMTSSTTAAPTSSSTSNASHNRKHGNRDGDRGIAIILGIMISLIAIAIAASIFWLLWRRKRQSGTYFKPARCSVCTTGTTEPLTSDAARSMTVTPWRLEATEPSRSYMAAAANYLNPKTGGHGAGAGVAAGPSDSAEGLPEVVQKPYVRHQVIQIDPVHPVYGRGPTKLQKSNSTLRRGVPEILNVPGPSNHIELPGDDLAAISEMDTESPSRRTSTWTTNPFVVAEQEQTPDLPLASVAARDAAFFSRHSRQNSRDFPPYVDNPAVTIQTASATSSEAGDLLDREAEDSEADIARAVEDPPSSAASSPPPPESPNWVGFPLSHQERELDANINPFAPKSFSDNRRSLAIPAALLAGGPERNLRSSPVPFSPRWRRNGHVPSRHPSPSPISPWGAAGNDSPVLRDHFNKSSPQLSAGPSPLTPSRSNPSPLLRNRIAEENRYLAEPSVHYPSWSEINEFNFEGTGVNQRQHQEDGGDGWRPVPDNVNGRYELAQ